MEVGAAHRPGASAGEQRALRGEKLLDRDIDEAVEVGAVDVQLVHEAFGAVVRLVAAPKLAEDALCAIARGTDPSPKEWRGA